MAALVEYSSSSSEEDEHPTPPPVKRKLSSSSLATRHELPPLPAAFLDQYSSTVRTSMQDDPALHGGRKRTIPHVQGNWPTHVYLEWHPNSTEAEVISDVVSFVQSPGRKADQATDASINDSHGSEKKSIHSLLENDLGVSLPLHVSLSRPLVVNTKQKDTFQSRLNKAISTSNVSAFDAQIRDLAWHPNETGTRWFLVLCLQRSADQEMSRLLETCNGVAREFDQPLLYAKEDEQGKSCAATEVGQRFHISIAWSLRSPALRDGGRRGSSTASDGTAVVPYELLGRLTGMNIGFREVKVRIGQDVHTLPLKTARRKT